MSHGSGWLIMKSAMMREKGASLKKSLPLMKIIRKGKTFLSVADLDHLMKSGRLTNASAFIGKILMLKPIYDERWKRSHRRKRKKLKNK